MDGGLHVTMRDKRRLHDKPVDIHQQTQVSPDNNHGATWSRIHYFSWFQHSKLYDARSQSVHIFELLRHDPRAEPSTTAHAHKETDSKQRNVPQSSQASIEHEIAHPAQHPIILSMVWNLNGVSGVKSVNFEKEHRQHATDWYLTQSSTRFADCRVKTYA